MTNDSSSEDSVPSIVCQGPFDYTCGYVALLNALRFGKYKIDSLSPRLSSNSSDGAQIDYLIERYGRRPSRIYKAEARDNQRGIGTEDLFAICSELRSDLQLENLVGQYLHKERSESNEQFLKRIYDLLSSSIEYGELPIIALVSQAAEPSDNGVLWQWRYICGHYITAENVAWINNSFLIHYFETKTGSRNSLFVYADRRGFTAYKGNAEKGEWLTGSPFLTVVGPMLDMRTQEQPWYYRTLMFMQYAITKTFEKKKRDR